MFKILEKLTAKNKKQDDIRMPSHLSAAEQKQVQTVIERARGDRTVPHSAQESIPFQRMFPDGICRVTDNYYTKTIQFQDINYQLAQQEDQTAIFEEWCSFLNFFDSSIRFELSFMNMATDASNFEKMVRIPYQKDHFNPVRTEYSTMLRRQLAQGNNGLTKTKYLTFGIEAESMKQAKPRLIHIEIDLMNNFKRLGVRAKLLNGKERLHLMHDMFHMGDHDRFNFDWKWLPESGLSVKDFIAPTGFAFPKNRIFQMGGMYGSMSYLQITASDLSDQLLKDFLDMQRFSNVKWDFIIIDEAHNLRNVFHGTKRAKRLYELSKGIPKILLTATPLQNSLSDLHGLISFIDPRIFGSEKVFNKRFIEGQDYTELKRELIPVLYRTLRRDVGKYMDFKKRECRTIDFVLSPDEVELYMRVNNFLKKDVLYSIPNANKGLIVLVIRKLLASSSYALIETFEVLKNRLQKLYEGTKSANAQDGFDLFWNFVEDEIDESGFEEIDDEDTLFQKQQIQAEIDEVDAIIETASRIQSNAKVKALKTAIHTAFEYQEKQNIPQKVVVFTESKRTQKYIASELRKDGFEEDDILLFNGDFNDAMTKEIYRAWQVKNFGKTNYGRSVEYKHAIVDYFKEHSKILIVTDAGSEGLNLQFCNTVINYDLPWNPQKIEQRIGRCHRYGQKYDVVAINLLNTGNEADRRVYEILSKKFELFDGVFGASDIALGALESGTSFEKTILEIYQNCGTRAEFKKAFDRLDRQLDAKRNKKAVQLRSILMTESDAAKGAALEKTKNDIDQYLQQVDFWTQVAEPDVEGMFYYTEE